MKPTEPSAGAMRAAEAIGRLLDDLYNCGLTTDRVCLDQWQDRVAAIIDRESGLSECILALTQISHAKADRLDHSLDVAIIDRAAKIAKVALARIALTKSQENALAAGQQKPRW